MEKLNSNIDNTKVTKDYEKRASNLAKSYSTFIENLIGKGILDKEDIIRIDAELENEQKENSEFSKKITDQDLVLVKKEKDMGSHSVGVDEHGIKEESIPPLVTEVLKGKINGQDVEIIHKTQDDYIIKHGHGHINTMEGWLNGKKLSEEEASKIYSEYYDLANARMTKIQRLVNKRREEKKVEDWRKKEEQEEK